MSSGFDECLVQLILSVVRQVITRTIEPVVAVAVQVSVEVSVDADALTLVSVAVAVAMVVFVILVLVAIHLVETVHELTGLKMVYIDLIIRALVAGTLGKVF